MVFGKAALVPSHLFPEIELFRVPQPCKQLEGPVNGCGPDVPFPLSDFAGEFLHGKVSAGTEKRFDDQGTAPAALSSRGGNFPVDPSQNMFHYRGFSLSDNDILFQFTQNPLFHQGIFCVYPADGNDKDPAKEKGIS
jgi:hypothetical protein